MIQSIKLQIIKLLSIFYKERDAGKLKKQGGILPDAPDERDYMVGLELPEVPQSYTLPIDFKKYVKNQGSVGSCGSHAMCTAIEIMHDINGTNLTIPLSERYHYYKARIEENTFPKDSGMTSRTMLKIAQRIGISPERLCPYVVTNINDKPDAFAEGFAHMWKIGVYFRVMNLIEMKKLIYLNYPILVGVYCNTSFLNNRGEIQVVQGEKLYGGHEFVVYGYDDDTNKLHCINSWDTSYKNKGSMLLPYEYIEKYMIDAWTFNI
jgi:hypothetical protein